MKRSNAANDNLIDRTRQVWQPRLGCDLNGEDARQIAENVTGFFTILAEWSRAEVAISANDNDARQTSSCTKEKRPVAGADRGGCSPISSANALGKWPISCGLRKD
jgi:hypothetical protein